MSFPEIFTLENKELDNLILCREEDKISTELEGETVILYLASGVYSGLDEVGTTIWTGAAKEFSRCLPGNHGPVCGG